MIVRAFADDPEMAFDFFNDYADTESWLCHMVERLDDKYTNALVRLHQRRAEEANNGNACDYCHGTGEVDTLGASGSSDGSECPDCRGLGYLPRETQ